MAPGHRKGAEGPATATIPGNVPWQTSDLAEPGHQLEALRQLEFPEVAAASRSSCGARLADR